MTELAVQQVLDDRFELINILGRGGHGTVWHARDLEGGPDLALKVLHPHIRHEPENVERLTREARLLFQLAHPNIARAVVYKTDGEHLYLAMEYIQGVVLSKALRSQAALRTHFDLSVVMRRVEAMAAGLDHAHEHHVVHRDIKPQNIMLVGQGAEERVKVLDFGIARLLEADIWDATTLGRRLGTPTYMSPEQARGEAAGATADVFALATITFEMLTLRRGWARDATGAPLPIDLPKPSDVNQRIEVLSRIVDGERPQVTTFRPELPPALDDVLAQGLATSPANRYPSAGAFSDALRIALGDAVANAQQPVSTLADEPPVVLPTKLWAAPQGAQQGTGPGSTRVRSPEAAAPQESGAIPAMAPDSAGFVSQDFVPSSASIPVAQRSALPWIISTSVLGMTFLVLAFFALRQSPSFVVSSQGPAPTSTPLPSTPGAVAAHSTPGARAAKSQPAPAATTPTEAAPSNASRVAKSPSPRKPRRASRSLEKRPRPTKAAPAAKAPPPKPAAKSGLKGKLARTKADDAASINALSKAIVKAAESVSDPAARRRIQRLARGSALVADLAGLKQAIKLLEAQGVR